MQEGGAPLYGRLAAGLVAMGCIAASPAQRSTHIMRHEGATLHRAHEGPGVTAEGAGATVHRRLLPLDDFRFIRIQNHTCTFLSTSLYNCSCTEPSTNYSCTVDTRTTCLSAPCLHGAKCTEVVGVLGTHFSCTCAGGYSGPRCDVDLDECLSAPCANGGACVESSSSSRVAAQSYFCTCPTGFEGWECEAVSPAVESWCDELPEAKAMKAAVEQQVVLADECDTSNTLLFCTLGCLLLAVCFIGTQLLCRCRRAAKGVGVGAGKGAGGRRRISSLVVFEEDEFEGLDVPPADLLSAGDDAEKKIWFPDGERYERAVAVFEDALDQDPANYRLQEALAFLRERRGAPEEEEEEEGEGVDVPPPPLGQDDTSSADYAPPPDSYAAPPPPAAAADDDVVGDFEIEGNDTGSFNNPVFAGQTPGKGSGKGSFARTVNATTEVEAVLRRGRDAHRRKVEEEQRQTEEQQQAWLDRELELLQGLPPGWTVRVDEGGESYLMDGDEERRRQSARPQTSKDETLAARGAADREECRAAALQLKEAQRRRAAEQEQAHRRREGVLREGLPRGWLVQVSAQAERYLMEGGEAGVPMDGRPAQEERPTKSKAFVLAEERQMLSVYEAIGQGDRVTFAGYLRYMQHNNWMAAGGPSSATIIHSNMVFAARTAYDMFHVQADKAMAFAQFKLFYPLAMQIGELRTSAGEMFEHVDADSDGLISFAEYAAHAQLEEAGKTRAQIRKVRATFDHFDKLDGTSGNGIDEHDFKAFMVDVSISRQHGEGNSWKKLQPIRAVLALEQAAKETEARNARFRATVRGGIMTTRSKKATSPGGVFGASMVAAAKAASDSSKPPKSSPAGGGARPSSPRGSPRPEAHGWKAVQEQQAARSTVKSLFHV